MEPERRGSFDMDDEDGRCLLDVICDPQALNDFLHGSDKIDGDDLLDNTGDAASAFFVSTGLHVQETPGNHLTTEPNPPAGGVDLDFLPDDILGSPSGASAGLTNSDQPCDILQQSLQEANITEQTLEAEAELDLGSFQLPTLQPVVPAAPDGTSQIFSGGADLIGLQQPAVLTHQALVQQSVGQDVVNKAISVQPFIQQVGLSNVTLQPISNLPGLPNGSPGGALGIGQIQVVGQQVMAINQPAQQIIAKPVQSTQVTNLPVGSYLAGGTQEQQQVALASSGVSPQNAGLVLQNKIPTVATTLNGSSMFASVSAAQCTQSLTVTSSLNSPVIIQRTPTPIQPKPAGVLQQKLFQISPKPFAPNNTTLTIQGDASLQQQQKAQQNLTFMAGKPGQNVVLSSFPQGLSANVFKQPPPQQQALGKHMSVQLLNQGSSIVIPAQHAQAMLQGQNQFLLPGASAVQQLSALQANMSGQILAASHPSGQAHIIASQGPGGQILNQALPAQILTNQNLASQLNLGQVLTSQNAHGTAHILSGPIQLQAGQVGQPTLFQMPVSLASSLSTQSQPAVTTSLNQAGQTVIQGVTLPNQVAMFNTPDGLSQAVSIQQASTRSSQSPGIVQQGASLLSGTEQTSILTVQTTQQPSQGQAQLQLNVQQQPPQQAMPSPSLEPNPDKIILSQATPGNIISAESMQMFLQQKEQQQQQFYEVTLKPQQESSLVQTSAAPQIFMPIYSIAASGSTFSISTSSSSSIPASVIVSSSSGSTAQPNRDLAQNHATTPESKGHLPHFPTSQSQQAMSCQIPAGQQKLPGASPSHTLPHPPSPQLQASATHHSQMQSPHQSRPPSRPPSRPHSRPPSQPQSIPRPPSEPLSRSCTPQMQNLYVIQNQISSSPHGSSQHPLRPPSQPQVQTPFPPHQTMATDIPQTLSSPQQHVQLQVQLGTTQPDIRAGLPVSMQATPPTSESQTHTFPVQFQAQTPIKAQTQGQPIHLPPEQQRTFQMTPNQFHALALSGSLPQQKQLLERFQQMQQQGLMLSAQQQQGGVQTSPAIGSQFTGQTSSLLISSQGQPVSAQTPLHGHSPGQVLVQSTQVVHSDVTKMQVTGVPQGAQLSTLIQQQQASVLVKPSGTATAPGTQDSSVYPGTAVKTPGGQGKSISAVSVQTPGKTGVISSVPSISLGKSSLQIQVVGKGIQQIVPTGQTQPQFENKFGALKKLQTLQPSKEACFLEQLHKHQGSVLHPDYKSSFHSFEDTLHRLLPYHVYQGLLPSEHDLKKVDDEFETVSTQLLKRTQAMLNKYRLLLLDESRRVSPSAEMVMIDRMFIQEEKVALSTDRQFAKERPDEYVSSSSSSRSQNVVPSVSSISSPPCPAPALEILKPAALQTSTPIHPTKLVIKHSGGGSPSVTWAKASPSLDTDDDALPSRSRPPIKTYEARSRIGLKLKIKQEAGLSKVIHNTALDPVHQNPPPPPQPPAPPTTPASTVIKTTVNPTPATTTPPTGQMNGTLDHSSPAEKKPLATYCRLPLRKTYRENVDAFVMGKPADTRSKAETPVPVAAQPVKQEDGSRSVITSHKTQGVSEIEKGKKEDSSRMVFFSRGDNKAIKTEEMTMSSMREVKDEDPGFYRRVIKTEPMENESDLSWEIPLPSAKRLKSEQFDVDNASFSSDSPQDDTLNEHLQSAIDSILNLQQPQSSGGSNTLLRSSVQSSYHHSSSSSPFSSPVHRTDSYLTPNHNGGLGARTLNR
ncbi:BRD4-interacting chromatin-remodeling complex-associated protein isoform X2 [Bufo gargarizans]|uniref:BRD4-interacting chromatin-remodeling complex-associated protein isoform X2 n=1 Tax=Bufo gargarizans TaxID=30331 RepID=UPI001CF18FA9|nr:BRD4-interacting chromatin-remodeling complex-associated protein isoform X2 [Bufo gargarizans]